MKLDSEEIRAPNGVEVYVPNNLVKKIYAFFYIVNGQFFNCGFVLHNVLHVHKCFFDCWFLHFNQVNKNVDPSKCNDQVYQK